MNVKLKKVYIVESTIGTGIKKDPSRKINTVFSEEFEYIGTIDKWKSDDLKIRNKFLENEILKLEELTTKNSK